MTEDDFEKGSLRLVSYARPAKLFTAHESLFVPEEGILYVDSLQKITVEILVG
jgi:hypothetical protein